MESLESKELLRHLLRVKSPWFVRTVVAGAASSPVLVYLEHAETAALACPFCGRSCEVSGATEEKCWRHLNTCERQTHILAKLPLVDCPEHGCQPASFPLAEADAPVTFAFARWVKQAIKEIGSRKKLAAIARLDAELLECILEPSRKRSSFGGTTFPGDGAEHGTTRAPEQPMQLGLFSQNDMILVNQGLQALRTLQLEHALELFRKHQEVYPKGPEVDSKIALAEFLLNGLKETQPDLSHRIAYRCHLWNRFVDFARAHELRRNDRLFVELQKAYFEMLLTELEQAGVTDMPMIAEEIPLGYLHLQAGHYEQAIRHLQAAIPMVPHSAFVYGYLGDAYWLRGDRRVARQCYREGCLIDPASIDWQNLKDFELADLRHDLHLLYGFDEDLAAAWLPSYARVNGLFERKVVRLNEGLKELVDDYVTRQKAMARKADPIKAAELFFRGIILCENEENLRLVKKIDPIQVRRTMKQANPELFAEFLATLSSKH